MKNYNEEYFYVEDTGDDYPMLNYIGHPGGGYEIYHSEPLDTTIKHTARFSSPVPRKPKLADIHYLIPGSPVISERIKNILESLNLKDTQFLPAVIRDDKDKLHEDFYIIHVYNEIKCMDKEKSEWEESLFDEEKADIEKLVLNNELIDEIPLEERLVFKAWESSSYVLYHRSVVEKILEIAPIGLVVYCLAGYKSTQKFLEEFAMKTPMKNYNEEYFYVKSTAGDYPMLDYIGHPGGGYEIYHSEPLDTTIKHTARFPSSVSRKPKLADIHYLIPGSPVISERIKNILESLNLKDTQFLSAVIRDNKDKLHEDFYIIHVYNEIKCMDKEKSKWRQSRSSSEEGKAKIEELLLDNELIDEIPLEERLVFKAWESSSYVLYHRSVVEKILEIAPIGLVVYCLAGYKSTQKFLEKFATKEKELDKDKNSEPSKVPFGQLTNDDILISAGYYEDEDGDTDEDTAWVTCEILKEGEKAYKDTIGFLTKIVNEGFPVRSSFGCESAVKNYINIRHDDDKPYEQCSSNQFWANASQYPALHEDIRDYIKLAAEKVEYLEGDQMEEDDSSYLRPDFYAMAALAMLDPTAKDFVELIEVYAGSIDSYYATDICNVGRTYLKTYGVTEENVANLAHMLQIGTEFIIDTYLNEHPKEEEKINDYLNKNLL